MHDQGPNLLSKLMIILLCRNTKLRLMNEHHILHAIKLIVFIYWFDVLVDKKLVHRKKHATLNLAIHQQ